MPYFSILLAASALIAGQQQGFQAPPQWTEAIEPFQIADHFYYVGSADLTSFLITSDEGHILIDVPMEQNVDMILGNIRQLGFDPADIQIQLASHAHFDHTGGIGPMLHLTGADLVLSEAAALLVGRGGKGDFHLADRAPYPPAKAARTIGHLERISIGERSLTAHLTPGHTKGCTSWSGEVEIEGEALTFVSICSLTVLGGYRLVGDDASYTGIGRDFCRSVDHLRSLEPDIFLSSHGSFIDMDTKLDALKSGDRRAFVDPEGYVAYLDRAQDRIEETLTEQGFEGGCGALLAASQGR